MGKTLKYVSEFSFPSDKGYSGSAGKQMVKGYARGGSCGMAKGGNASAKMDRLKGVIGNERKEMTRVEAKQRDAGQELSRVRSEMRYDKNEMKGMRKQYPTNRSEPMVAMKKGGHVSKKIMKKFDGGYIQDPAASGVPQAVSPLTQIANSNPIPQGNTFLSPTAMKHGGKVGAKLVKMADGGAMVIRDPSYSPTSTTPQTLPPVGKGLLLPQTQLPVASPPAPGATPPPQFGQMTPQQASALAGKPFSPAAYNQYMQQATGGVRPPAPGATPPPQSGQTTQQQASAFAGKPSSQAAYNQYMQQQQARSNSPNFAGRAPYSQNRPVSGGRPPAPGATPPSQSGQMTQPQARSNSPGNQLEKIKYNAFGQRVGAREPAMADRQSQPAGVRPARSAYAVNTLSPQSAMKRGGAVKSTAPKSDMLYSKKEISGKNLLPGRKFYPPNRSEPLVNMAGGGKVGKVMAEFKAGELHSGSKSGPVVKSRKQAIAIGLSEARKAKK